MALISDTVRQDTVRQILVQLQNITGRTDVESAARTLELQAFQTCTGPEDYFGKIASRISAFSKRMANKPAAAGTGQAQAPVCLPLQTQTQQPRPYFQQQVASTSGQDASFSHLASGGQQNAPGFFVPATGMMQQGAQPQNFAPGMPRPLYVSNAQGGESYQMQQQPGLILSQDPAVRMQQLQQHPEITSPGYPMMQRPNQMIMQQQQLPMHGRQQQMHVPQGTMFQPRPQPSHVFRPQQMPGQPQLVPQQQQQQQQQPPQQLPQQQQQPNATSDAAEQYWALQERMRDAYLPSLREIQRMHKGTVRGGQTASKVESLLKATLPHLALDRKDQAAQGKTALPSDLQNLRHVEHLYGKYLQGIAAKSAQRPQSRQQPSSQATEGFPGSQGPSKLPAQQAPAQSAASSRAPTPQPLEPASVQAPMPQLAAPAESSGEAPGKAAFDDLDLTETSRPNAVAAALDASELVTQMDSAADFDFVDDFLGLFPSTPKPAGAMAAAASDISRMLWQNDTDLPFPPKDFTPSLEDWMCPESSKPLRTSTPISSAFIDGFLQDLPTSTELSSSTELDPVYVLGHKRKSGSLDEACSEASGAKKQCQDRLEQAVQACRGRVLRTAEVAVTGSNDYAGVVSVDCRVEPILPGMDPTASRITNRHGALLPETWKSLTVRVDENYPDEPPVVIFNSLKGSYAPQADAARSVFETAISATRSPLSLDVIATNWQKSVASVVKVFSRTAGAA